MTRDLKDGEVLADEEVTGMSDDEFRRPLDIPRKLRVKLRVEFYSQTNSSWADQLDEGLGDICLLDPVDEQRNLIETLISLGVDQGAAVQMVSEINSLPRITKMAPRRPSLNVEGVRASDLCRAHPGGG